MMHIGALLRRRSMADLDAWHERSGRALHMEGRKPDYLQARDRVSINRGELVQFPGPDTGAAVGGQGR
jgi:hypothetical protein